MIEQADFESTVAENSAFSRQLLISGKRENFCKAIKPLINKALSEANIASGPLWGDINHQVTECFFAGSSTQIPSAEEIQEALTEVLNKTTPKPSKK